MEIADSGPSEVAEAALAPELDPPAGERKAWLENVLPNAEFTVLLFYRGLW